MKKEKILLLTDVPLSKNYSGGIMSSHLMRFLIEEKHDLFAFIPWNKTLIPDWDESVIHDVKIYDFERPSENISGKEELANYKSQTKYLAQKLVDCINENKITKVWCIIQGELICNLMNIAHQKTNVDYVVQIWDPIEWWMDSNNFSKSRKKKTKKEFAKLLSNSKKCITTSYVMSEYYSNNYNVDCLEVMPSIENRHLFCELKEKDKNFHVAISGQIYAKEEMEKFLCALDLIDWEINEKKVYLHHFGEWDNNYINFSKHKKHKNRIIIEGYKNQKELISRLNQMDLLYCPYFFSEDENLKLVSSISFPSKLVTYLTTGIPTILHAPKYSSPYKFCDKNKCAYLLSTTNEMEIAKYLKESINNEKTDKIVSVLRKIFNENFAREIVKDNFLTALDISYDKTKKLRIFEINNVDLPGRKFNGYDLLDEINNHTKNMVKQIVTYKTSKNDLVFKYYPNQEAINEEWKLIGLERDELSVHSQLSYTTNILKNHDYFNHSDVVHYHLIHNTKLSLDGMVDLCNQAPSVLTIHDPWIFTGRCAYNQECEKWLTGCHDCEYLDNLFPFTEDNCHSLWELKKKIYKNLDIDIVVSCPFMVDMVKQSPLTKHFKNVHLIPFGIDLTVYKKDSEKKKSREELGVPQDHVVFFFRSQMAMKGTEFIVEAMEMLKTDKKVTLLSCDEIGNLDSLKGKYNVVELGHIGNETLITAYNACDVFLMPSRGESFGLMTIEAMAAGRPVVVFNNTASPSVSFAPECGVLVENKNSKKLMEAINWMIEDKEERIKRGKLGRELAIKHYDINVYHEKINQLYEDVYNRQKEKEKIIVNRSIDYNDINTKKILFKLNKIWEELNCQEKFKKIFPNYNGEDVDLDKIDYSNDSVQEVIKVFNDAIYEDKKEKFYLPITDFAKLKEIPYIRKKDRIGHFLKKRIVTVPFYYLFRTLYRILRKIKRIIFRIINRFNYNKKTKELNNKIDVLEKKLYDTMIYAEYLETRIANNEGQFQRVTDLEAKTSVNYLKISEKLEFLKTQNVEITDFVENSINSNREEIEKSFNSNKELIEEIANASKKKTDDLENKVIGRVKNILFYHGGAGNHGCEALIKSITKLAKIEKNGSAACSYVMKEDYKFGVDEYIEHILDSNQDTKELANIRFDKSAIAFSIGGDNYCGYDYGTKRLEKYNTLFNDMGIKTALIGCSIEPDVLEHQEVVDDLHNYSLITARESITYNALLAKGLNRNTHLIPDSAFSIKAKEVTLPDGFIENNTIGVNISNMVQSYDKESNLTYSNYINLVKYILNKTEYSIALIPHVVQDHNDDLESLERIYDEFKGNDRVILVPEHNCFEIKYIISKCKMLVCTRTHASIAGYSSLVPTLVLGYSVKSKGIAKDIFGTHENYVISVNDLKRGSDLTEAFNWFDSNYGKIKKHLNEFMPNYIDKVSELTKIIDDLRTKKHDISKLPNEKKCTGCLACSKLCPKECISQRENKQNFVYPQVNYNDCIECDICRINCPINKEKVQNHNAKFYAVVNNDKNIRKNSTSGGVFNILARMIINDDGVVFGAYLDNNLKLRHIAVDKIADLPKIMKSKYIQSNLGNTYEECKVLLEAGKKVLFCGTPCQIAGLKSFLKIDYGNLLLLDFVCHGVPNQIDFDNHIKKLEKKYGKKIKTIDFRDKTDSWMEYKIRITFKDNKSIFLTKNEDEYMHSFLSNKNLRDCCYSCQFNNYRNYSDITIGDLWSAKSKLPEMFDDLGTSLMIINTEKGQKKFEEINEFIKYQEIDKGIASFSNYSLENHLDVPSDRDEYFEKTS